MCEGRHPKPPHEVVGPVAPLTMAAWPLWSSRADAAKAVQMPAMKVAPLLDDLQAMQAIEVIGDDVEPQAETVVLDGPDAGGVWQGIAPTLQGKNSSSRFPLPVPARRGKSDLEEVIAVASDDASSEAWQVDDSEVEDRRGQPSPSPILLDDAEARADCTDGSAQVLFVSHFSVGAPLPGTAHRSQVQAARGEQPGAEAVLHHDLDNSQFDGWARSLQCEQEVGATPP